ncbi:MAG: type II toxin-antitoxin system VapC family toxin [Caldilineaceae bacterium]|nr:type II toxin-antitoxin system VapC family toxin [Caldilineaceae bacterium]
MIVLDASALLAMLYHEPGHEVVAAHLHNCCMSTVNLAEVVGRFVRDGHASQLVLQQLKATSIEFVPFSVEQSLLAAQLLAQPQSFGLSLADRACIALALLRGVPALTADRAWLQVQLGATIRTIR